MNFDFKGKTAVITGASRGIGATTSILLAEAGAKVMMSDIGDLSKTKEKITEQGRMVETFTADITKAEEMEALCEKTVEIFGNIDILVNCPGILSPMKFNEISTDIWKKGIDVNLSGAFYIAKYASKTMLAQKCGRIIFIGSAGSITGGGGVAYYAAAKAGINGLVRSLSKELAPLGITVNSVLPALIDTDMLRERQPNLEKRREYIKRIPVGRLGKPEDVAYAVLFLASEYASYITGQNILIDGGSTLK
jgi:3-oxoacyl-[acyl-carrier protein] reductase